MEIIRHKTQKIIVIAMLTIMIMCIATPVFAARNLEFKSNMEVTKLNKDYELKEKYTTGQKVWWNTEGKGVITIVNGGLNRYGKTFVRFQANKEGKEYLIAKDAETNGKEVARCLVEVKLPDSGKKDDGKQPAKKDWEMPDWNWNIELPKQDFEMPDLNIDTSGIGEIGEGLISGIGQIGESGIFENLLKMITDLITGIIDSIKNINFELPAIGNTNIFKPEEKVLKLEIGKKELKVGETTIIKAIVNGEEVNEGKVTFDTYYYNEDGTQTNEILYSEVYAISIKAEKVGKVVINATYKYKEGFEEKEIRAQEEIKIKSRTLKLEIGKTNMNVDETTNLKATIDGQAVSAEFKLASYDQNGKAIKDNVVEIKGEKVTALKAGKAVITATWANSSTREIMSAKVEVQIKEKPQQQQQNPPQGNNNSGSGGIQRTSVDPKNFNNNSSYSYSKSTGRDWVLYCKNMDSYLEFVEGASKQHGVSADVIMAIIMRETNAKANLVGPNSSAGRCQGLMQLSPVYAPDYLDARFKTNGTYNLKDPETNIYTGTKMYKWFLNQYGTESNALSRYSGNGDNTNCNYVKAVKEYKGIINQLYTFN